jgi:hypothetical protein
MAKNIRVTLSYFIGRHEKNIREIIEIHTYIGLLYEHIDFGNQFFSLTSTYELHDKATVKIIRKGPMITLDLLPLDESGLSSTLDLHPL